MLYGSMPRPGSLAALSFGVLAIAACGTGSTSTPRPTPTPTPTSHSTASQISAIGSTGSTCKQFSTGTLSELTQIRYTKSGTKVAHVAPPTFDYWVKLASASSQVTTLTVIETTHGASTTVTSTGGDVFSAAEGGGTCVVVSNSVSDVAGVTHVSFAGTKGATYFVQVHYSAAPFVGQTLTPGGVSLTVSTKEVTGSSSDLTFSSG